MPSKLTPKILIQDNSDSAMSSAIEVVFELANGRRRWCFFMTPEALVNVGDWVPGTQVRFHYDAQHMIVVSEISDEVIHRVIDHLAQEGVLERCSLPVGKDCRLYGRDDPEPEHES